MTCPTPINTDRAQLYALNAADPACSDLAPASANPAPATTCAQTTELARRAGGVLDTLIASRSSKSRFRSNEARKRFLAVHRQLATYLGAEA